MSSSFLPPKFPLRAHGTPRASFNRAFAATSALPKRPALAKPCSSTRRHPTVLKTIAPSPRKFLKNVLRWHEQRRPRTSAAQFRQDAVAYKAATARWGKTGILFGPGAENFCDARPRPTVAALSLPGTCATRRRFAVAVRFLIGYNGGSISLRCVKRGIDHASHPRKPGCP